MAIGFPGRFSFRSLGGLRADRLAVTHPLWQIAAEFFNAVFWQVAGMNRVSGLVSLTVASNGDRDAGAEAWNDQDDVLKRVVITHDTTGEYQITCDAEYPDHNDDDQAVEWHGAIITPIGATSVRPPTFTLDSANQITVYTWNASGVATDMGFSILIL